MNSYYSKEYFEGSIFIPAKRIETEDSVFYFNEGYYTKEHLLKVRKIKRFNEEIVKYIDEMLEE